MGQSCQHTLLLALWLTIGGEAHTLQLTAGLDGTTLQLAVGAEGNTLWSCASAHEKQQEKRPLSLTLV
jgi:hypothetical protein